MFDIDVFRNLNDTDIDKIIKPYSVKIDMIVSPGFLLANRMSQHTPSQRIL